MVGNRPGGLRGQDGVGMNVYQRLIEGIWLMQQ